MFTRCSVETNVDFTDILLNEKIFIEKKSKKQQFKLFMLCFKECMFLNIYICMIPVLTTSINSIFVLLET